MRIAIVTSGGDAPGMNACIRAVVKGSSPDVEVVGVRLGGLGLLRNNGAALGGPDYVALGADDVRGIIDRSGTILGTSRAEPIYQLTEARLPGVEVDEAIGRLSAEALSDNDIDGLILVGGDTTCRAALSIAQATEREKPIVVVPATIDNDIRGTAQTLGFDSAVQMAVHCVDSIRATASAMERVFIVEVMGRNHGQIALETAYAVGAEEALIPEQSYGPSDIDDMAERLLASSSSAIVIVAEGVRFDDDVEGRAPGASLQSMIESRLGSRREVRLVQLGHVLRGAPPTALTRNLATKAGLRAIDLVVESAHRSDAGAPTLVGINNAGVLTSVEVVGDMVRRDRRALQALYNHMRRLAY